MEYIPLNLSENVIISWVIHDFWHMVARDRLGSYHFETMLFPMLRAGQEPVVELEILVLSLQGDAEQ